MMKKVVILAAVFFSLMISLSYAAAPAWVVIHDTGLVWGEDILLGSIADISCADEQRRQQLINMKLGIMNKPGSVRTLSAYVLRLRIQSSGIDSSDITWSVPDAVTITRASQTVSSDQIVATAQSKIKETMEQNGEQRSWTFDVLTPPSDTVVPPGQLTFDAQIPYGIKYTVPTVVYVDLNVKGQTTARVLCRFQLHVMDEVAVAARAVRANTPLTEQDVRIEKKEVGPVVTDYVFDLNKAVGRMSRYPLKPGDLLRESFLTKPILIKRGALVHIVANKNGLNVQTDGLAMADGGKDDFIQVKNTVTGTIVNGKVVDENTVEVQLD
ncbi:flagellar basal body P-ring formation chaperone FlgA [Pectinatus frisingensis]|uniref:flagellar basal body P-ring formation chaperone FlgA n=1 Tax=Pectinatus frisingensis TaxID=865 RepID=UPI0015F65820|nr:flagellar basal body P-ring formation chaperone FlgA [Pectinatus frisingensis]